MALVLETLGGHKTLDLGSLGVGLLALALGLDLAADDVLADLLPQRGEISVFCSGSCALALLSFQTGTGQGEKTGQKESPP